MSYPWLLLPAVVGSALVAWVAGFIVRSLALRTGWVDVPDAGRHRHGRVVALAGGCAAWLAMVAGLFLAHPFAVGLEPVFSGWEWYSLVFAPLPLLVVGLWDDRRRLRPVWLLLGAFAAIALCMISGVRIEQVTNPGGGTMLFSLGTSLVVTFLWLLACVGATKFADGADGLVAGQTVIGSALIVGLCLSPLYAQPSVALLAALFGGSFLGVLWHNWPRAKLFLGEFGSTYAGLGLGVLASISGAKVAIALMAMGVFVADIIWVMMRRVWRGRSPLEGDRTHLYFLLAALGMPSWLVAVVIWGLGLGFGLAALQFQTQGKLLLVGVLILLTAFISYLAEQRAAKRGKVLV